MFERGVVVVFDIEGQTPSATSEALMLADRVRGTALMASGLLGGNCYPDGLQAAYSMALNNPESVVVFDAARNTLGILDAANKRLFVTRGAP
ncbi:hypothetical protein ACS3SW_16110 [Roseobacteraceae bacterium S113]